MDAPVKNWSESRRVALIQREQHAMNSRKTSPWGPESVILLWRNWPSVHLLFKSRGFDSHIRFGRRFRLTKSKNSRATFPEMPERFLIARGQ